VTSGDVANDVRIAESNMPYFDWDPTRPGADRLDAVKMEWKLMIRLVERIWSQRDSAPMRQIASEWFTARGSTAAMNVLGNILWFDFEHNFRKSFARVTVTNRELRQRKHKSATDRRAGHSFSTPACTISIRNLLRKSVFSRVHSTCHC
jgi:hypothetical protein